MSDVWQKAAADLTAHLAAEGIPDELGGPIAAIFAATVKAASEQVARDALRRIGDLAKQTQAVYMTGRGGQPKCDASCNYETLMNLVTGGRHYHPFAELIELS